MKFDLTLLLWELSIKNFFRKFKKQKKYPHFHSIECPAGIWTWNLRTGQQWLTDHDGLTWGIM